MNAFCNGRPAIPAVTYHSLQSESMARAKAGKKCPIDTVSACCIGNQAEQKDVLLMLLFMAVQLRISAVLLGKPVRWGAPYAAKKENLEVSIIAMSATAFTTYKEPTEVLLLGPQVSYMLNKMKDEYEPKGIKVGVINMMDYGMMNGEKVLHDALEMID